MAWYNFLTSKSSTSTWNIYQNQYQSDTFFTIADSVPVYCMSRKVTDVDDVLSWTYSGRLFYVILETKWSVKAMRS